MHELNRSKRALGGHVREGSQLYQLTGRGGDKCASAHGVEGEEYGDELHGVCLCDVVN